MRVGYVWGNLGHYHRSRMVHLAEALDGTLHVAQLARKERIRDWFGTDDLQGVSSFTTLAPSDTFPQRRLVRPLIRWIRAHRLDVVVWGTSVYGRLEHAVMAWTRPMGVRHVAHLVSTGADARPSGVGRTVAKAVLLRAYDGVLPVGQRQADHAATLGVQQENMAVVGNPVDAVFHTDAPEGVPPADGRVGRLPRKKHWIVVGRLSPEKNIPAFLRSYRAALDEKGGPRWGLHLVGDGPERSALESQLSALGLLDRSDVDVALSPFLQRDNLRRALAQASALALPSLSEPWGLVAGEAAAMGLPLLLSERCGCLPHLLDAGLNGVSVAPTSEADMTRGIIELQVNAHPGWGAHSNTLADRQHVRRYAERTAAALARLVHLGHVGLA